jgi:hypothetical protein
MFSKPIKSKTDKLDDKSELIFVYNAKSGIVNGIIDYAHKNISPETYACNLCALTYNNFGKIKEWDTFIRELNRPISFKYKNHLPSLSPELENIELPVVLSFQNGTYSIFIHEKELSKSKSLAELISLIKLKLLEESER